MFAWVISSQGDQKGIPAKICFNFFQISLETNPNWKKSLKHTHQEAYF